MEKCAHHIKLSRACPWCKREGFKEFGITKPRQLYQAHFAEFLNLVEEKCLGPANIVLIAEDANGSIYEYSAGELDGIELLKIVIEGVIERKRLENARP